MSFGKSSDVRLDANGKKPLVFWEHQHNQAKRPKKKFSYKEKSNKFPLRDTLNSEEPEPSRNVKAPPKRAPVKSEAASKPRAAGQKPSVTQQNGRTKANNKGKPTDKGKDKQKPVVDDKVTLTQTQFDRILETIGELTLMAEEKENTDTHGAIDLHGVDSSFDVNHLSNSDPASNQQEAPPTQTNSTTENPVPQPDNLAPGSTVPKLDISSPRYYDPRAVPQGPVTGNTRSSLIGVPFAHMTKAERKRMEWERQKAEEAALQKQVDHTERFHGTTTGVGQETHQPRPGHQSTGSVNQQNVHHQPQPGHQSTASQQQQASYSMPPQTLSSSQQQVANTTGITLPSTAASAVHQTVAQSQGNTSVVQNPPTHIISQPPVNSIPGLTQHRESKPPIGRVASRSSVIVNEPASVPGLNVESLNQPSESNQAVRSPVVHSQPQTVPGLVLPQQTVTPAPVAAAVSQPTPTTTIQQPQKATRGPLTKAELKRFQWEKERAEEAKQLDWDPWGKPGAGAPIKDGHGNVLADFATRKSMEEKPGSQMDADITSNSKPHSDEAIRQSYEDVSKRSHGQQQYQAQTQHPQSVVQQPPPPQTVVTYQPTAAAAAAQPQTGGGGVVEAPPAAIRSSFTVGAVAPDDNKFLSVKEQQRRQWVADLEKQREEQRLRKLQQIQKDAELDMKDMGYKDIYKPIGLPDQQIPQNAQIGQTQPSPQPTYATSVQQPSQPGTYQPPHQPIQPTQQPGLHPGALPSGEPSQPQMDTFIRGQNVNMDETTRRELENKRKKQMEHQEYIKQQINEKERQKKEEREKKWAEENEIELKMQRERDDVQKQGRTEQDKARQREDNDRRKVEMLKSAMDQEKERADWEKHEKRMLKLRKGGHDVSGYHATFQSKHTPRDGAGSVLTVAPSFIPGLGSIPGGATSQMTSYPDDVLPTADAYMGGYAETRMSMGGGGVDVRSSQPTDQQYTENRVLTPSVYRSPKREFGVQADLLGLESLSRESTDIEYKGPIKKKVRVKSAAELKVLKAARDKKKGFGSTVARPTDPPKSAPIAGANKGKTFKPILKKTTYKKPIPVSKRPAWGSSANTNKKVTKQSERDPFYEETRKQSEERGLLRQQMLLEMAEQETPLVYSKSTAAARARSRSLGKEEEAFEAPGAVHVSTTKVVSGSRSKSPGGQDYRGGGGGGSTGHRSRVDSRSDRGYSSQRSNSPPVPALKNRMIAIDTSDSGRGTPSSIKRKTPTDYTVEQHNYDNYSRTNRLDNAASRTEGHRSQRYSDTVIEAPVQNGQFVPFIRSTNILDPSRAEEHLPISREPSTMQRARQAYVQEHEPAKYGTAMENFNDSRINENVPVQTAHTYNKDPIINPSVVTDHPSHRQNRILQQLSDLRKGLMQKQRELEVGLQAEEVVG